MKCFILQGVSGSGKSALARRMQRDAHEEHCVIVSADHFFMVDGAYRFDPAKLPEAHAQCLKKFIRMAQGNTGGALGDIIIVDNTNSTVAEIAPYYAIAEAYGYDTRILRVRCRPDIAAARGIHGVSEDKNWSVSEAILAQEHPRRWRIEIVEY